jgi:hypothetical protein
MICIPLPYFLGAFLAIGIAHMAVAVFVTIRMIRRAVPKLRNPDGHSDTTLAMMVDPQCRWSAPAPHDSDREDVGRYGLQILRAQLATFASAAIFVVFVVVPC